MRLPDIFTSSESIVALLDAEDGRFLDVNGAFERITGYGRDRVIGQAPIDVGLWNDLEFRAQLWESLRAERRVVDAPTLITCADGRTLPGRLHVELVLSEGERQLFCILQVLSEDYQRIAAHRRESLYRDLFVSAAQGIYRSLPGGGFLDANPAMARILGFDTPAELLAAHSQSAREIYFDQQMAEHAYRHLLVEGRLDRLRIQVLRRDGSLIWISENTQVIRDADGQPIFFEGTIEDVTAQVEAEQALTQSQNLYRVLLDNSRDGVFLVQRGYFKFVNHAMADMLGYRPDELVGKEYMSLVDQADEDAQISRKQSRESGQRDRQMFEMHLICKDGRRILCEIRADAVDYQGDIASTGTLRDITVERQQQRALVEAERRYRELFYDSPVGLFQTSLQGDVVEVNPTLAAILGYASPEDLKSRKKNMLDIYVDPAERQLLVERAIRDGSFSHYETRVFDIDRQPRWVSANVRLTRDENNQPSHFTGSVLDIQGRYEMQQALLRSENKYRSLVEQSHIGVFMMSQGCLVYVNRALGNMLGLSEGELLGRAYRDFLAPDVHDGVLAMHEQYLQSGLLPSDLESCLLHSNGQRVHVRVGLSPIEINGASHVTGTVLDITRQREAETRLRFHATHDPLTGLPNRALFNRMLADRLSPDERRGKSSYAVLFLDLDGFKWVNDSLGHGAGDRLLLEIARRLEGGLHDEVLIARYGGDEFTLLPEGACDYERAVTIANRVLALFEQPFDIGGQQIFSAASLGIVLGRPDYESPDQVLRDADNAMYRAKAAGKLRFVVFDEGMHAQAQQRLRMETDFRLAFERGEFRLHYQPIVDLATGRLVAAEALVRWQHPKRGLMESIEFLPFAEETGLITDLDGWVLGEACRQLALWRRAHVSAMDLRVNVNMDERQIASREIIESVFHLLQTHKLPPSCLRLEVTESVFRSGSSHALAQLGSLKALGVSLAVDDFGTGYSSLESFAASSFDALKVDQSFIRDLVCNSRHRAIVRTIIGFARDLGLMLTAEGIETEEQRALLLQLGCQYGQGYLFDKPLPPHEFEHRFQ